jgi:hypothetical protein
MEINSIGNNNKKRQVKRVALHITGLYARRPA